MSGHLPVSTRVNHDRRSTTDPRQYLAFVLAGETYAMAIRSVREVIQYGDLTHVPLMPPAIRGVINLRGSVVPVVDLCRRFGWDALEVTRRSCIVILDVDLDASSATLGVIVDQVRAVLDIPDDVIEPVPSFGHSLRHDFLAGVARIDGGLVTLLDVAHVLSLEDAASLAQV